MTDKDKFVESFHEDILDAMAYAVNSRRHHGGNRVVIPKKGDPTPTTEVLMNPWPSDAEKKAKRVTGVVISSVPLPEVR